MQARRGPTDHFNATATRRCKPEPEPNIHLTLHTLQWQRSAAPFILFTHRRYKGAITSCHVLFGSGLVTLLQSGLVWSGLFVAQTPPTAYLADNRCQQNSCHCHVACPPSRSSPAVYLHSLHTHLAKIITVRRGNPCGQAIPLDFTTHVHNSTNLGHISNGSGATTSGVIISS